jgi:transglutaminase-like putative cysteine protease
MLYRITHTTRYIYESAVSYCINEARLMPRATERQQLRLSTIRVDPLPGFLSHHTDYFGNDVTSLGVFDRHEQLVATAESIVEVLAEPTTVDSSIRWEEAQEAIALQADDGCLEASEFVYDSPFVTSSPELAEFARKTFTPGRPLIDAVKELSHRIYSEFEYKADSTSIDMPLREVLKKRRGVCQDFAHIMIGALRSMKLPARYVSGYVRPGPKIQGAQASHAWVSAFVPGVGWLSFDPTNDVMPSEGHIVLAWGRDYGDVTPLKGVTLGGGRQKVEVEVYVKPTPPAAPSIGLNDSTKV